MLMTQGAPEAITSMIPCGASVLDLRSDRHCSPIEMLLPYGCSYAATSQLAEVLSVQYLQVNRVDYLVLDITSKLDTILIRASRLVAELGLTLVLQFDHEQLGIFVEETVEKFGLVSRNSYKLGCQQITRIEQKCPTAMPRKRVCVVSCAGWPNFGDRLGFHLIHGCLPPSVSVRHLYYPLLGREEMSCDLLILWLGSSVFKKTLSTTVLRLLEQAPRAVGIFGTQYRRSIDPAMMAELLGRLSFWYARYEEDLYLYGRDGKSAHLGDWLIDAFPITEALQDGLLTLGADLISQEVPLDRLIQKIQSCKRVASSRLHPLLCAMTSAEQVSYREQREFRDGEISGKFRSLFLDVFGRDYPESQFFPVDRDAVITYKSRTSVRVEMLRRNLKTLLGLPDGASHGP